MVDVNEMSLRDRKAKSEKEEIKEDAPMGDLKTSKVSNETSKKEGRSIMKWTIVLFLFSVGGFYVAPLLSYLKFTYPKQAGYIKLGEVPKFEGNLELNTHLQNAVYLAKGKLIGPESIVFINDTLYTGLKTGQLVRVDNDGNVHKIVQIGDETDETKCKTFNKACGRPLGIRFKAPNFIYVADAYFGIVKVDLTTNTKTTVLSVNDNRLKNGVMLFTDDLDMDDDGNIYFSDYSAEFDYGNSVHAFVLTNPNGMVYRFNEITNELELLMDDLYCANGIQLTPAKDAILVSETCASRITKYYLNGDMKGKREIFALLPGFPDNLRLSERETLLVAILSTRQANNPSILDSYGEYPFIRTFLTSVFDLLKIQLESAKSGLVLEYDFNGNLLKSWHDPNGLRVKFITQATLHKDKLYLSNFLEDYISIVDY